VIQVEITPYTQMTLASMDRDLLVVIITVVTGLMLLFFAGCELRIDSRSEDLRQPARSLQYRMAEPTAMRWNSRRSGISTSAREQYDTLEGESDDVCR
jgi:hypothetical protein